MQVIKKPPAKHSLAQSLLSVWGYEALPADLELWLQHTHIHPWELPQVTVLLLWAQLSPSSVDLLPSRTQKRKLKPIRYSRQKGEDCFLPIV